MDKHSAWIMLQYDLNKSLEHAELAFSSGVASCNALVICNHAPLQPGGEYGGI